MTHQLRHDRASARRLNRAALLFLAAMAAMAGVGMWILASGSIEPANPAQWAAFLAGLVAVFAAAAYVFFAFGRLRWFYRCPQCGARLPLLPQSDRVGPQIRYSCDLCEVEWMTGWTVAHPD
jgi:hypothetical protein